MKPLDLKLFAEEYVALALRIADAGLPISEFDASLRKTLADKFDISEEEVTFLHHSFHWTFFLEKSQSPIGLSFNGKEDVMYVIRLEKINPEEKSKLVNYVIGNYGDYLAERLKNLINTAPQSA